MSIIQKTIAKRWNDLSDSAQQRAIASGRINPNDHWELREEGHHYDTIHASSAAAALAEACSNVERSNYHDAVGTIWIDVEARNALTGESESGTVQLDEDEPECARAKHDWQSPYSVLGGLKENPGVWGKGGGVIIREVCAHCGKYRITDTWAQRRDTGEQGLESVSYKDADSASNEWIRARHFEEIKRRLSDIIDVRDGGGSSIACTSIEYQCDDDGEPVNSDAEDLLAEIRAALGAEYTAEWTGNGNGDEADVSIDFA